MIPNLPAETQLSIVRLEIERQIQFAKDNKDRAEPDTRGTIEEFIKDAEELDKLLLEYEDKSGRLKKLKRAKVIIKLTKKVIGLKRKYKDLNPVLKEFGEKEGFYG